MGKQLRHRIIVASRRLPCRRGCKPRSYEDRAGNPQIFELAERLNRLREKLSIAVQGRDVPRQRVDLRLLLIRKHGFIVRRRRKAIRICGDDLCSRL